MNKQDLINNIASVSDFTKTEIEDFLGRLEFVVSDALCSGQELSLPGIGKFKVKQRAARNGRNPKSGAPVAIAAKQVVKFSPARTLAAAVA